VPVTARSWGFKSPLAHTSSEAKLLARGLGFPAKCIDIPSVVTVWSRTVR